MADKTTEIQANLNKRFIQYVAETKTEYKYTLKFAIPEMTDYMVDCLEECLGKYQLRTASAFKTTPIQESPLDFPNVKNMPVQIAEITMGYPASLDFLRVTLGNALGISPQQIAVYSENDPRQIETDLFLERSSPDFKKNYVTKLGSLEEENKEGMPYTDAAKSEHYGEGYNTKFLQELAKVQKEREIKYELNALSQAEKIDHSNLPSGYNDYLNPKNSPKSPDNAGLFGRIKKSKVGA